MEVGSVIGGRYRLIRQVGEGAMAAIWEAEHLTLGRPVAVKFLHTVGPPQSEASQRFVREARVAAQIKHRNVVDIIDFGLTDGDHRPYMVMELLEGQTLNDYLRSRTRLAIGDAARIVSDVLRGLAAVHDAGIVHRDIKPDNIFLVEDEDGPFPKLVDFGLSRRVGRGDMTAEGIILGTPDYMSPEQAQGQRHIDARTDIYSMGVIFYELVTGQMPFDGGSLAELLAHVIDGKYMPLEERLVDAPPLLVEIIARAMNKDRTKRYGNAREMRAALAMANLAPFAHGDSGLMTVDQQQATLGQLGGNPPSGVFREVAAKPQKVTLDEESKLTPHDVPAIEDLESAATRATASPVSFDDDTHHPTAPPPEPPGPPAGSKREPTSGRRRDESAGVFQTTGTDEPARRGGGWLAIVLVIALASVVGGLLVYWMQTGGAALGLGGAGGGPPELALDASATQIDGDGADAGAALAIGSVGAMDAPIRPAADARGALDAGLEDAPLAEDIGELAPGADESAEEDAGRRRGRVRRRPRPRPRTRR